MKDYEKELIKDKVTNSTLGKILLPILYFAIIYCVIGGLAWLIGTLVSG